MTSNPIKIKFLIVFAISVILANCGGNTRQLSDDEKIFMPRDRERMAKVKKGRGLLQDLFFKRKDDEEISLDFKKSNLLWKASLDVLSDFPLSSVDNKSGLIITDWYSSQKKTSERFKITVLILSNEITAGSLKVSIHRQVIKNSRWVNIDIERKKSSAIERKIINKAIELRTSSS